MVSCAEGGTACHESRVSQNWFIEYFKTRAGDYVAFLLKSREQRAPSTLESNADINTTAPITASAPQFLPSASHAHNALRFQFRGERQDARM